MAGMACARYPLHGALAALLILLLAAPSLSKDCRRLLFFLLFAAAGFVFAHASATRIVPPEAVPAWVAAAVNPENDSPERSFSRGVLATGTIVEATPLAGRRTRILLKNVAVKGESDLLPGLLVLTWQNPPPDLASAGPGQNLTAALRIREIRGFANPGTWETESYWRDRGAYFRAWSKDDGSSRGKNTPYTLDGAPSFSWNMREKLRTRTAAALTKNADSSGTNSLPQQSAIIMALLFGDRSLCTPETLDMVAKATLAHSLALSGMHLGFAAGLGYATAHLLGFLFPALFLRIPRQKAGILLALPAAGLYLWLGGAPPSLQRAALMLLFWAALLWLNRPKVLLDGLLWAVAVILIVSPESLYDIRLQLSAVSVAGIALAAPALRRCTRTIAALPTLSRRHAARGLAIGAVNAAGISIAAQLAVLPLTLDAFPGTGLWFPLNLIWLPILGLWVTPLAFAGIFATATGLSSIASALFLVAELPCSALLHLLHAMDTAGVLVSPVALRPAWPAMAGYWLLLLTLPLAVTFQSSSRRILFLLAAGFALVATPTGLAAIEKSQERISLRLIDVGQGQAALISWQGKSGSGRALVDGGGFASGTFDVGRQIISPVLTANAPPKLDWLVNTHPDADHLHGLLFPLAAFTIKNVAFGPDDGKKSTAVIARRDAILQRRGFAPIRWQAGDVAHLAPGLALEVLHPGEGAERLSANDKALVLRLVHNGKPLALICGDIERQGISQMLARKHTLKADVLVLPHHGSASSFSAALYDAVAPQLALASCGYANPWKFPARKVRDALAERGVPLATTADKGHIAVTWDKNMRVAFTRE